MVTLPCIANPLPLMALGEIIQMLDVWAAQMTATQTGNMATQFGRLRAAYVVRFENMITQELAVSQIVADVSSTVARFSDLLLEERPRKLNKQCL